MLLDELSYRFLRRFKIPVRKYKTDRNSLQKTQANNLRKTVLRKLDLQMHFAVLKNPLKSRKSEEKTARNMTQVRKADGNVIYFSECK